MWSGAQNKLSTLQKSPTQQISCLAQLVEHWPHDLEVLVSIPTGGNFWWFFFALPCVKICQIIWQKRLSWKTKLSRVNLLSLILPAQSHRWFYVSIAWIRWTEKKKHLFEAHTFSVNKRCTDYPYIQIETSLLLMTTQKTRPELPATILLPSKWIFRTLVGTWSTTHTIYQEWTKRQKKMVSAFSN